MSHVDFPVFDCDNHYYEALDAFSRYIEPEYAKRGMQWVEVNGKKRLMVGEKINRFIPNPTFDPVSKPGALDEYFRGRNPKGADTPELFGELDPMTKVPEYRDREARLKLMDEQGIEGAIFLPTLGVGMEQSLSGDKEAIPHVFHAFNRWLEDDWGFNYQDRIFSAAYITLVDPDNAVKELEWALERDVRFILIVPGPVMTPSGGKSPADPIFDPFWARVNEAGVTVSIHGGDSHYSEYLKDWGETRAMEAFRQNPFRSIVSFSAVQDFFANTIASGLFERFPNLRMASIETGSDWVFHLFDKFKKSYGQTPHAYAEDPRETFRKHVWVSPYYEDELGGLRELLGADHMLMGSDYPHAEGLAEPSAYIKDLKNFGFSDEDAKLVMYDNGKGLSQRQPA
jgi:predicted TIM-barrel fold metal-dependent hydrolase